MVSIGLFVEIFLEMSDLVENIYVFSFFWGSREVGFLFSVGSDSEFSVYSLLLGFEFGFIFRVGLVTVIFVLYEVGIERVGLG